MTISLLANTHVYCCSIYNIKEMEPALKSINSWMLNKNVIHGENGTLIGQSGITKFARKWTELENNILNEAIQAQKDKHCNFPLLKCPASNVIYVCFEEARKLGRDP